MSTDRTVRVRIEFWHELIVSDETLSDDEALDDAKSRAFYDLAMGHISTSEAQVTDWTISTPVRPEWSE